MKRKLLKLSCIIVLIATSGFKASADIIGPPPQEVGIPAALLAELDQGVAEQLKALIPLFANNDFAGFKDGYAKIFASTETLPAVEVFWAKLLISSNRPADATRILEEYLLGHSNDAEAYITLGVIGAKSGRFTDAWLQFLFAQQLIDQNELKPARLQLMMPSFIEVRCIVAENRHQWAEAEQMFEKLRSLRPEDHSVQWRAGRCQVLAGKTALGHEMMKEAHEANPQLPRATLAVAQILSDRSDWSKNKDRANEVESWFVRSIEEMSSDGNAHAAYFKWLLLDNRPETVREKYDGLPPELKSIREIIILRCLAARYLADFATAETLLMPIHQQNPDDMEVADQLALVLVESPDQSKREMALQLAERNFRAAANIEAIAATAAWVQLQASPADITEKIFAQLINRGSMSAQTTYYVSEFLRRNGRVIESRKLLKAAADSVGLFPQRAQARLTLSK